MLSAYECARHDRKRARDQAGTRDDGRSTGDTSNGGLLSAGIINSQPLEVKSSGKHDKDKW